MSPPSPSHQSQQQQQQLKYYTTQLSIYKHSIHPYKICLLGSQTLHQMQEYLTKREAISDTNSPTSQQPFPEPLSSLKSLHFSNENAQFYKLSHSQFKLVTELLGRKPLSMDLASVYCALFLCHKDTFSNSSIREEDPSDDAQDGSCNISATGSARKTIHYLDLCSSPGMKLIIMSLLFKNQPNIRFVATDISSERLIITRKLFRQWNKEANVRLLKHDGRHFCGGVFERNQSRKKGKRNASNNNTLIWEGGMWYRDWIQLQKDRKKVLASSEHADAATPAQDASTTADQPRKKRKLNPALENEARKPQSRTLALENPTSYDFIIIDAECTTDGSIKHVHKFLEKNGKTVQDFLDEKCNKEQVQSTALLQRQLLENGFKRLKLGGTLLYSTCSLMKEQNEDVVSWLLKQYQGQVKLVDCFENTVLEDAREEIVCKEGFLKHTLRFNPEFTGTNGLFVAKLQKIQTEE